MIIPNFMPKFPIYSQLTILINPESQQGISKIHQEHFSMMFDPPPQKMGH